MESRLTPHRRIMREVEHYLATDFGRNFFGDPQTIEGLISEQKRLDRKTLISMIAAFTGALLAMIPSAGTQVQLTFGFISAPISIIPQQIFSFTTCLIYAQFLNNFKSIVMLVGIIRRTYANYGIKNCHIFIARYDASSLWISALTPDLHKPRYAIFELFFSIVHLIILVSPAVATTISTIYACYLTTQIISTGGGVLYIIVSYTPLAISICALLLFIYHFLIPTPSSTQS